MATSPQPLSRLREGTRGTIDTLPPDVADECAALRLLPGEFVEIVQVVPMGGPILVRSRGGLYAIGRGMADLMRIRA